MGRVVVMQQLYAAASRIDDSDLNTPKTPTHHTLYYPTTLLPLLRLGSVGWILLLFLLPLPCAFRMVVAPGIIYITHGMEIRSTVVMTSRHTLYNVQM